MKRTKSTYLALLAVLLSPMAANADLIVTITDSGGFAEFSLSGSDTVVSGSSFINGVWVHGAVVTSMIAVAPVSTSNFVVSGSGEITNTQFGSQNINDVFVRPGAGCCQFGFRNGNGGVLATGDPISWSGVFTTSILFSAFNTGTYSFDAIDANCCGGRSILEGGVVFIITGDSDDDGVPDNDDFCPDDTAIPEGVPTSGALNPNHWALTDGDGIFDTVIKGKGKGPNRSYTIEDTAGCSCEQIIEIQGLGDGHSKHGCSISAMDDWIDFVNPM